MKLVDTSVAIDHLRGHQPATALIDDLLSSAEAVAASEITRFELLAGARNSEHDELDDFFLALEWVPVTEAIVRRAGTYARSYHRSHSGIGAADYVIAGTASALGIELLTVNVRHFPMFEGIQAPYQYN